MNWMDYLPPLLEGAAITAQLAAYSTVLGAVVAFALGLGRFHRHAWVRGLCTAVVEFFRGTSLLVQLFWLFFALPLVAEAMGYDWRLSPMLAGILALSLNIGAYGAEVVRGALQAVRSGQLEAGLSLGLTPRQALWRVRLPQALPEMMPSLGNLAVQNLKDTALVSLISLADMAFRAEQIRNLTQDSVTVYTMLLLMYFGMALVLAGMMKALERHVGRWRVKGR